MDKTLKYTSTLFPIKPKETTEDILKKLEDQFGKEVSGSGFAIEKYDGKN